MVLARHAVDAATTPNTATTPSVSIITHLLLRLVVFDVEEKTLIHLRSLPANTYSKSDAPGG
jgi:hypothetical protein